MYFMWSERLNWTAFEITFFPSFFSVFDAEKCFSFSCMIVILIISLFWVDNLTWWVVMVNHYSFIPFKIFFSVQHSYAKLYLIAINFGTLIVILNGVWSRVYFQLFRALKSRVIAYNWAFNFQYNESSININHYRCHVFKY